MSTITSTGLGSGLDINSTVQQLIAADRKAPDARLNKQEAALQGKISAWGTVKSSLADFQGTLSTLKLPSTFQKMTATVSDSNSLTVTAATNADSGNYSIEVSQLAQQHTIASNAFADLNTVIGTGTLMIKFGTTDYDPTTDTYNKFTANSTKSTATITIDSSNNTLIGVRDAINSADIGVTASVVNDGSGYRLVMNSDEGGANNSMQISVADDDGNATDTSGLSVLAFNDTATNATQTVAAQDALLKINGLQITSASNTITTALKGLTINLLQAQAGKIIKVGVSQDTSTITDAMNKFVTKYNDLNSTITSVSGYDNTKKVGGVLQGDMLVLNVMSQLRNLLTENVKNLTGSVKSLVDIGMHTNSDGTLALDQTKLTAALAKDPQGVEALFRVRGTSTDSGIAYRSSTSGTQAGSYAVNLTQIPTQGYFTGGTLSTTTVDATNNQFKINVDGTLSDTITLTQGDYTTSSLVSELQNRINDDSILKAAGAGVDVSFDAMNNHLVFTSKKYGSISGAAFFNVTGTGLGLDTGSFVEGTDAAGTIGGFAATGTGQNLTVTEGAAKGLSITVSSGQTGSRGNLQFSRGILDNLDNLLNNLIQTKGTISSRTQGLESSLTQVTKDRAALDQKMESQQTRLLANFNNMDKIVAALQSTSSYLTQQLSALPYSYNSSSKN